MPRATYSNEAEIPAGLLTEYEKRGDVYVLKIDGDHPSLVPRAKVEDYRTTNVELQKRLEQFRDIDPEEYRRLKAKGSSGAGGEDDIDARVKTAVAPIAQQLEAANAELAQAKIGQAIIAAASKQGVLSTAIDDVVTRGVAVFKLEQGRVVPYINGEKAYGPSGDLMTVEQYVASLVHKAPHLFGKDDGTGGATFHGVNPWEPAHRNLTKQAQILKRDRPLARRLAQQAGAKVTF